MVWRCWIRVHSELREIYAESETLSTEQSGVQSAGKTTDAAHCYKRLDIRVNIATGRQEDESFVCARERMGRGKGRSEREIDATNKPASFVDPCCLFLKIIFKKEVDGHTHLRQGKPASSSDLAPPPRHLVVLPALPASTDTGKRKISCNLTLNSTSRNSQLQSAAIIPLTLRPGASVKNSEHK